MSNSWIWAFMAFLGWELFIASWVYFIYEKRAKEPINEPKTEITAQKIDTMKAIEALARGD